MNLETYAPSDLLKPFVKRYMIIESEEGTINRILPDTSIIIAFRLKGRVISKNKGRENDLPTSVIAGLRNSSRLINYSEKSATLLVMFREGGAAVFFNDPLHELFGLHTSLDSLVCRKKLEETEEQLAETKNNRQRITVVERFLFSQLDEPEPDALVYHSIQKIKSTGGDIRIRNLAAELSISLDPFEKRFRRVAGTSPKQFSRIVRLRNVINSYSEDKSLTETAYAAGYYDQPHFIKDFKSFTGQSPKKFFASPSFW